MEVMHVQNVVHGVEVVAFVLPGEIQELVIDTPRGFFSESHGIAVQSAKSAVMLCAPPASTRGLKRQFDLELRRNTGLSDRV